MYREVLDVRSTPKRPKAVANKAPSVALTSPTDGASFTGPASIALTAGASDADGSVSKVEFYQGSTLLATTTSSPYSYDWTGVTAGSYTLTARATDNAGATAASSSISLTVTDALPSSPAPTPEPPSPTPSSPAPSEPPAGALNVRNYGAQGNGSANDTASIQAAVNACPTGGAIYFPAGTYNIAGSIEMRAQCTYAGDRARSILRETSPGSFILRKTSSDPTGIKITNMVLDGGGIKIDWEAYSFTYQYNVMKNLTSTYGVYLPGGANGALFDRNIFLSSPNGHYISSTNEFTNVKVTNNYFDTFYQGLESVGPLSTNVLVDNNTFVRAQRMAIELMQHINYLTVTNNYFAAWRSVGAPLNAACDARNGFECDSFAMSIANGEPYVTIAYNKAYGTPGTSWGLELTVSMPGSSVHDNALYDWDRDIVDIYSDPAVRPAIVNNVSCGGFADRNIQAHLNWPSSDLYSSSCAGLPVAPVPAMPFDPNTGL